METPESQHLLESLVRLTEKRDQHELERCLVDTLPQLSNCLAVVLYELQTIDGGNWIYPVAYNGDPSPDTPLQPLPAEEFPACSVCMDSGSSDSELLAYDGRTRIFYPVPGIEGIYGCLVVETFSQKDTFDKVVDALLQINLNFMTLLHDSERDTLTSLYNRKKFDARIIQAIDDMHHRGKRNKDGASIHLLCLIDIDHFKKINDNYGHLYGDEVLLIFARLMQETFRTEDWLFRYGGEEFVVILRNINHAQASAVLNRFREKVAAYSFPQVGHITISIGYSDIVADVYPSTIVEQADAALYYAKEHGRNQTHGYHDLIASGQLPPKQRGNENAEFF